MKQIATFIMLLMIPYISYAQVTDDADGLFDSTTYVETNGATSSSSTVTSTNTNNNNNVNTSTNTNNNNNVNTSTSTNTNTNTNNNILSGGTNNTNTNTNINTSTSTNTNNNNNVNVSTSTSTNNNVNDTTINATNTNSNTNVSTSTNTNNNTNTSVSTVESNAVNTNNNNSVSNNTNVNVSESVSESTATNTNTNNNINENRSVSESNQTQTINQRIESPPPSAIAPSIGSSFSQDLCTTGVSGAVQTQIFGISGGKSITDTNCERIKLSKTMYDMGMRVAAVALMCQDERVWTAMKMAGTPCPYQGMIGDEAGAAWEENLADVPGVKERDVKKEKVTSSPNMPR